jgi:hypothetical protein
MERLISLDESGSRKWGIAAVGGFQRFLTFLTSIRK